MIVLGAFSARAQNSSATPNPISRVCYAAEGGVVDNGGKVNSDMVARMVNSVLLSVTGKSSVIEAWRSLVRRADVIGIKVSAAGGAVSGTHPEIVQAVAEGLIAAGIPREQIIVWDRRKQDLLDAGFTTRSSAYELRWIEGDGGDGYDKKDPITAPVLGKLIWGDSNFKGRSSMRFSDVVNQKDQLSDESHLASILAKRITRVINIPALCDSYYTGVAGSIPNMTLSNVDNWRRFITPPRYGDPYLAEIYADPKISGKVALTILDAIVVQYAGGPFPDPRYAENYFGIFMSRDPVAIDATAMRIIDDYRIRRQLPKIEPISTYIQSATSLGLGNFEENKIQKIRVGVEGFR